jgi:hypothetical protein
MRGNQSLHEIEGAVENWRQQVLPEIEASLLTGAQSQFTQEIKKTRNRAVTAHESVWIKTLHGKFVLDIFKNPKNGQDELPNP